MICQYILYICIYFKQMSFSVKLFAPCILACPCCCWHARQHPFNSFPQNFSANLSPLPGGFPAKIRNIWFSLTQTSRLRSETIYLGKSLNLSRESKPNQSRSTQKEDINVHLPKIKKNNTINKQNKAYTNKQTNKNIST